MSACAREGGLGEPPISLHKALWKMGGGGEVEADVNLTS